MKKSKLLKLVSVLTISILTMGSLTGCGGDKAANAEATPEASVEATSTPEESAEATPEAEKETTTGSDVIVMGTNAEFPPFEYYDGPEVVGFDVEIAKAVAEKLGKELVIEDMAFDSLILGLNNGRMDFVAAGMTVTEEREQQVSFSQGYFNTKQVIIVKADNEDIKTADDLVGKKVGVQLGTTGDIYVSGTEGVEVVQVEKGAQAVMELKSDKVDAVVIDAEPAKSFVEGQSDLKVLDAPFVEEEYAIAVQKDNEELLNAINETIDELKETGKYDEIYAKFFTTTN